MWAYHTEIIKSGLYCNLSSSAIIHWSGDTSKKKHPLENIHYRALVDKGFCVLTCHLALNVMTCLYVLSLNKCNLWRCYSSCRQGNQCVDRHTPFIPNVMTFQHTLLSTRALIQNNNRVSLMTIFWHNLNSLWPSDTIWHIPCFYFTSFLTLFHRWISCKYDHTCSTWVPHANIIVLSLLLFAIWGYDISIINQETHKNEIIPQNLYSITTKSR